jgi:hypothetical protein
MASIKSMESLSDSVPGNTQPSITPVFKQVNIPDYEQKLYTHSVQDSEQRKVLGLPRMAQHHHIS